MRLRELEAKQDELTERLSRAPVDIPDIHPNVAGLYRRKVERLAEALQRPQERDEAAEAIRALIDHITLTPGPRRGEIDATLHGNLGTILEWTAQKANTPGRDGAGVSVSMVAGARNALVDLANIQGLLPISFGLLGLNLLAGIFGRKYPRSCELPHRSAQRTLSLFRGGRAFRHSD